MPLFTFWGTKDTRTRLQKFATEVLMAGPIPEHVAVIMDGNRRYAKKHSISLLQGYQDGCDKLGEFITWCRKIGVKEITTYIFSIENFKRSDAEKEILFKMFKNELEATLEDDDDTMILESEDYGCAIRFIGDWALYPEDLKPLMAELTLRTRKHTKCVLNIAFAYTSRNEIARAAETLRKGILAGDLKLNDITQELLNDALQIHPTRPVDLLIRTSDTYRLSDFMLWQSAEGVLHFLKTEWPELSFWEFASGVFKVQRQYRRILEMRNKRRSCSNADTESKERHQTFINKLKEANLLDLEILQKTLKSLSTPAVPLLQVFVQ